MQDSTDGLCSTCNYRETCVRREKQNGPIWYCEEFDDYVEPPLKESKSDSVFLSPEAASKFEREQEKLKLYTGICVNCENRKTCDHWKFSPPIWECNEYV